MSLTYQQRVLRVLEYIHDNPAGDLSLDALADIALLSRFHWHRVFHAMTGETCAQAVRRIRLHLAATWLLESDCRIAEVAARVGYPNLQSFSRAFSDRYGVSPSAFKVAGPLGALSTKKMQGNFTMFTVDIESAPQRLLGAILHRGPYEDMDDCYAQLSAIATTQNLWPLVQGMIGVHYDDPNAVAATELRAHAGLWLADETVVPSDLAPVTLPAGPCAVLHYQGPYLVIKVAYDFLYGDWLPKSGREPVDVPPYEIYLNNPEETPESDLLTDIVLPLAS